MDYNEKEDIPEYIMDAVSSLISQYLAEHEIKNNDFIVRLSAFCEHLVKELYDGNELAKKMNTTSDIEYLYKIAEERKLIIQNNKYLYKDLIHLIKNEPKYPEYVVISIIKSVVFVRDSLKFSDDIENEYFYARLGENLCLDIPTFYSGRK